MNKFWLFFVAVVVAEIPCILRTTAMQIKSEGIWPVISATLAANAVTLLIGIFIAKFLIKGLPEDYANYLQYAAGLVFVGLGISMFFSCGHSH